MTSTTVQSEKFVLSLSPDYVSHWGFWEAVRELLQNAIDQKQVNPESEIVFTHDEDLKVLTIGSTNSVLTRQSLLLGVTTKTNNRNAIGQFGEGYKLAMLVLARLFLDVEIHNGDEIWRPAFEFNDQYGANVLTVSIEPAPYDLQGVAFRIGGVPRSLDDDPANPDDQAVRICYDDIHQNYLIDAEDDVILDEEHMQGRLFVGGLFVCKLEQFRYGYNFSPKTIKLGRDRGMANMFDVKINTSNLWQHSHDDARLYDALYDGIPDVDYVTLVSTEVRQKIIDRYMREHPGALPVASQKEADYFSGNRTSIVPGTFRNLLWGLHKFKFSQTGKPHDLLDRFSKRFRSDIFDDEGRVALDELCEMSKHWNGPTQTTP